MMSVGAEAVTFGLGFDVELFGVFGFELFGFGVFGVFALGYFDLRR